MRAPVWPNVHKSASVGADRLISQSERICGCMTNPRRIMAEAS